MLVLEIFYIQKNAVFLQEEGKWYIFTWIQIKQVQKPWLFYILSTNKNTYIRHFHSTTVVQILHFAHSHGEKQNRDVIFHCKFLHEQLLSWQTVLPTFITDKKISSWYLSTPIPLSDCLHIMNDDFILRIHIFDAEVYRSSSCICSQSLDGKMEVKQIAHTHKKRKRWTSEFRRAPCTSHGITLMENALELFTLQTTYLEAFGTMAGRHCGETFR